MINNITNRNISFILAVSFFSGLIYCIYHTIVTDGNWIELSTIAMSTAIFTKFYFSYRKAVKRGNIYGKVNPFK